MTVPKIPADIVRNARYFQRRWQRWPMEGWLRAFADRGLIRWNDQQLDLLRLPTSREIDAALTQAWP